VLFRSQTASVIGTEIPLPLLEAIAELPEEALHRGLTHLQVAEFLYETHLFPERLYTFKHALTHEVAYGSLLQERRRALHARIVEAIEGLTGTQVAEQVERLAHHTLRGEVWDKALVYCRQAGEKALAQSAYDEAVGSFEKALSTLPHLPETCDIREQAIDLRLALRTALQPSGDLERILAYLREAEALAEALNDPRRLAQVSVFLILHFQYRGAYDQSITVARRALTLATASSDVGLQALAHLYLGGTYIVQGDYRQAIDYVEQTLTLLDGARRLDLLGQVSLPAVQAHGMLAWCHAELGTFAEGREFATEGLRIAETTAHPASLTWASYASGLFALRQGDIPRALALLERAVASWQGLGRSAIFSAIAAALGAAYTLDGRVADAVALLIPAMEQSITTGRVPFETLRRLSLGETLLLAGRLDEAHALAEHTLAHAREYHERSHEAYALHLLGNVAARRALPESASAEPHYHQALATAEELGMRPLQAHCHLALGTLYIQTGGLELARAELTTAIALYRAMDMTFWLPQAEAALTRVEGQ